MQEIWIKKVKKIKVLKIFIYLDSEYLADYYHGSFSPIHKRIYSIFRYKLRASFILYGRELFAHGMFPC